MKTNNRQELDERLVKLQEDIAKLSSKLQLDYKPQPSFDDVLQQDVSVLSQRSEPQFVSSPRTKLSRSRGSNPGISPREGRVGLGK